MRLFFAVPLPDPVRERLAGLAGELREKAPDAPASWVAPQNVHLTLRFLGEVDDALVPELQRAAGEVAGGIAPFGLLLEHVGTFGGRAPRVVWVGVRKGAGHEALAALASGLDRACRALGFPRDEKGFKAHAMIARIRDARPKQIAALAKAIEARRSFAAGECAVDRFVLYESRLHGGHPPEYVEAASFTLTGKRKSEP